MSAYPVTYELITKPVLYTDVKTRRVKRKSLVTKNDLIAGHVVCLQANRIKYRYVLADSWFSAKENLQFIRNSLDKHFVVAIKSNRTVALSYEDKRDGRFARIDAQNLTEDTPVQAWIKGLDFPVLLIRQVFTNKDESTGRCFWLVVILLVMAKPSKRSIKNDGKWRRFIKPSSPMPPYPSPNKARAYTKQSLFYGYLCRRSIGRPARQTSPQSFCPQVKTLSQGHSVCF